MKIAMEQKIYKYKSDKRTLIFTIIYLVILLLACVFIWFMYVGGYFSAWFISVVVALIALMTLSIPRRIVVDQEALTIVCMLEIVEIPLNEIASACKVDRRDTRWMVPLFASHGFFGYYGYYLDLNTFERVKFYTTERNNLIEIEDIYDDRYYISCRNADELLSQLGIDSSDSKEREIEEEV